jgi:RNA polymerase sigma factor (sigma-70 family)
VSVVFSVLFEVHPKPERWKDYLGYTASLRPELAPIDGFVDNIRYRSLTRDGWLLSLSNWRDEKALSRWRTHAEHHEAQEVGRSEAPLDYHLRIGQITLDTRLADGHPLIEQCLDETETGGETTTLLIDARRPQCLAAYADPGHVAAWLGLAPRAAGLASWDVYDAVHSPGELILQTSWHSNTAAGAYEASLELSDGARLRRVRVVRDYGCTAAARRRSSTPQRGHSLPLLHVRPLGLRAATQPQPPGDRAQPRRRLEPPRSDVAVRFAARVTATRGDVVDDDLAAVRTAGYTDAQIIEIEALVIVAPWAAQSHVVSIAGVAPGRVMSDPKSQSQVHLSASRTDDSQREPIRDLVDRLIGTGAGSGVRRQTERPSARGSDEAFVVRLQRGDEEAFRELVGRYDVALRRMARRHVDDAVADDVVQDTWMTVIRGIDRFEGRSSLRTWTFGILINVARRRAQRERRTVPFDQIERSVGEAAQLWPSASAPMDPVQVLSWAEMRGVLSQTLREISPAQREVLALRDLEGWSAAEVCVALDITEVNQRALLHRARVAARTALEGWLEH